MTKTRSVPDPVLSDETQTCNHSNASAIVTCLLFLKEVDFVLFFIYFHLYLFARKQGDEGNIDKKCLRECVKNL